MCRALFSVYFITVLFRISTIDSWLRSPKKVTVDTQICTRTNRYRENIECRRVQTTRPLYHDVWLRELNREMPLAQFRARTAQPLRFPISPRCVRQQTFCIKKYSFSIPRKSLSLLAPTWQPFSPGGGTFFGGLLEA